MGFCGTKSTLPLAVLRTMHNFYTEKIKFFIPDLKINAFLTQIIYFFYILGCEIFFNEAFNCPGL